MKFRNLAKISRPNRSKKKKKEEEKGKTVEGDDDNKRVLKNGFARVEVVDDDDEEDDEHLGNLMGEEEGFGRKKWKGSTRLLLLDERYSGRGVEELPEAIKVVDLFVFHSQQSLIFCECFSLAKMRFYLMLCIVCKPTINAFVGAYRELI